MERLKDMGLKRSFFLLSLVCLIAAFLLTLGVYLLCGRIADRYPKGGVAIGPGGVITKLEQPSQKELQIVLIIEAVQLFSAIILPAGGLGLAGLLFYRLKLKEPIAILQAGTERIRNQDLDFSIPEVSRRAGAALRRLRNHAGGASEDQSGAMAPGRRAKKAQRRIFPRPSQSNHRIKGRHQAPKAGKSG